MTPEQYYSFARLRTIRQQHGLKCRDVARRLGIGSGYYARAERQGDTCPLTPLNRLIWTRMRDAICAEVERDGYGVQIDLEERLFEVAHG